MKSNLEKKRLGKLGEDIACSFLEKNGYSVAARNYTVRGGEIDIVAYDGEHVVFVEVKCRENDFYSKARCGGCKKDCPSCCRRRKVSF